MSQYQYLNRPLRAKIELIKTLAEDFGLEATQVNADPDHLKELRLSDQYGHTEWTGTTYEEINIKLGEMI